MRVLLVDIDSLRPDRPGCYGYGRETSPTTDVGRARPAEMAVTRGPYLYTDASAADAPLDFERAFGAYRRG